MRFSITSIFVALLSTVYALPEAPRTISSQTKKSVPSEAVTKPGIPATTGRSALFTSSAAILGGGALIGASIAALRHSRPAAVKTFDETSSLHTLNEEGAIAFDGSLPRIISSNGTNGKINSI